MSNTFPHNRFARRTREDAAKCVCFLMLLPFNFSVWFRFQNATEYSPEKDARLDFCQTILPALRFSSIYLFSAISFLFAWLDFLDRGGFNMSTLRLSYYFDGWHELSSALLPSFGWKLNAEKTMNGKVDANRLTISQAHRHSIFDYRTFILVFRSMALVRFGQG